MRKLLPVLVAALLATAACAGEEAEAPTTDGSTTGAVSRPPAPAMDPSSAAVAETATVTVDPAAATDPPPAVHSTAPAASGTTPPAPQP